MMTHKEFNLVGTIDNSTETIESFDNPLDALFAYYIAIRTNTHIKQNLDVDGTFDEIDVSKYDELEVDVSLYEDNGDFKGYESINKHVKYFR